ncbi:MAG TPA: hypothetical protein VNA65_07555 [Candidatus Dormibacteraeota bacterium]|nr:hypothetical protein [Candidatus Dormibacteraeota bacterium]
MPELTPEERLEVESDRRRRVAAAFRLGSEATPGTKSPAWWGPLLAGLAIALVIALILGVVALARVTSSSSSPTPSITRSPGR